MRKLINIVYTIELVAFVLIALGVLPRQFALYLAIGMVIYVLRVPIEEGATFFVRSIPFFIALPITASFDNFNTWRILSIIIFIKWIWPKLLGLKYSVIKKSTDYKLQATSWLLLALLGCAMFSIIPAPDKIAAIKRIIYFVNLSLIGIVIYDIFEGHSSKLTLIKNTTFPVIIVTVIGFIQLASTYFMDIYQFMNLWGEKIQCNQFGKDWCYIAVWKGNTWLAYYGPQLSLRVFSTFPDSHSFPVFLLLGLPAVFAIALYKVVEKMSLKQIIHTRAQMSVLWIPTIFLIIILTGTRGIWAVSVAVALLAIVVMSYMKWSSVNIHLQSIFKYISFYLVAFFMLFSVAYPIFVSPQFLLSKGNWALFGNRIKSIVDFGETSNAQRIGIWKASLESIKKHPLLGVGIGNYPVVLSQDIKLAKAGSSAHNLYLHIAAEMGIPALLITLWFFWLLFQKTYYNFVFSGDNLLKVYYAANLLFIPWVLAYLMTDAAIFDERAFLIFATVTAIILSNKKLPSGVRLK